VLCLFLAIAYGHAVLAKSQAKPPRVIDLTHRLEDNIATYFVDPNQHLKNTILTTVEKNGFATGIISFPEHFGTHIDAPCHIVDKGATIDQLDPAKLVLPAVVIDVCQESAGNPDYHLNKAKIVKWERQGKIPEGSAVLLYSGWSKVYKEPRQYRNADKNGTMHFPGFSADAVRFLTEERKVAALGTDTLSIDPGCSKDFGAHHAGLTRGIFFMENLDNLHKMPARGATLFCGALPIKGGSGSPARILALVKQ